ncbi:MAG: hypothetical protein WDO14_07605 [Bacteroidota bacterium]
MKYTLFLFVLAGFTATSVNAQRIPLVDSGEVLKRVEQLQDSQKFDLAIKEILSIPKRDTNYVASRSVLAALYMVSEQFDLADATADYVLQHPTEYGAAMWRVKGNICEMKKEYDKGIAMMEAASKKYPFDSELLYLRGTMYHNKHDYKNAVKAYYDVLSIAPRSTATHLNLGNLALYLGDKTHAMLSLGMYMMLRNTNNEKLQLLERVASNQVEWEGNGSDQKINNNAYERLDQILRSSISMDKKFKTEVPINIATVKQFEMLLQQMNTASESVDDPWVKFYGPIYSTIRDKKLIQPFLYHILESSSLEEVKKWSTKHQKELNTYYDALNPVIVQVRETITVPESYNIPSPAHTEYEKNLLEGFGAISNGQRSGRWMWLHRNGEISAVGNYTNGKKSGEWKYYNNEGRPVSAENVDTGETTEFYRDGSQRIHYFLKNEVIEGQIAFYFPCGTMSETRTHKDGKRTGKGKTWYQNGVVRSEFEYVNDKLSNTWTDYDVTGKVIGKAGYKDGMRDGTLERFWPNGKTKDKYVYVADKAEGPAEGYHNNGVLRFKGQYINDEPVGEWIYQNRKGEKYEQRTFDKEGKFDKENIFYAHGKMYAKHTYKNGLLIEVAWYDESGKETKKFGSPDGNFDAKHNFENGQLLSEGKYKNGKKEGKWTTYFIDGILSATYNYVDGEFDGQQVDFFRSGQKYSITEYKNGERDGYQQWFYSNGKVSREGWELKGKSQQQWLSYYADGTVETDGYYRDGEGVDTVYGYAVDGKIWARDFYVSGEKTMESSHDGLRQILYNDEKSDGARSFNYASGSPHTRYTVKCGKVEGVFERLFPNGKVFYQSTYHNDERTGHFTSNDADGAPIAGGDYLGGSRTGLWTRYNKAGKVYRVTRYVDGDADSIDTDYYAFGKPYQMSEMDEGELEGISRFLAPDGTVLTEKKYISDQLATIRSTEKNGQMGPWRQFTSKMSVVAYYPNGVKAYEEEYENGTLSGAKRIYFSSGKLCREYHYVNGNNDGSFVEYYPNGKLCLKGQYRFNLSEGVLEAYDETGALIKTVSYKLDELHGPTVYYSKGVKSMEVEFYNGLPLK